VYAIALLIPLNPVANMLPPTEGIGGESNSRIAPSIAAGLRCMYRCVVARSWWPASSDLGA